MIIPNVNISFIFYLSTGYVRSLKIYNGCRMIAIRATIGVSTLRNGNVLIIRNLFFVIHLPFVRHWLFNINSPWVGLCAWIRHLAIIYFFSWVLDYPFASNTCLRRVFSQFFMNWRFNVVDVDTEVLQKLPKKIQVDQCYVLTFFLILCLRGLNHFKIFI